MGSGASITRDALLVALRPCKGRSGGQIQKALSMKHCYTCGRERRDEADSDRGPSDLVRNQKLTPYHPGVTKRLTKSSRLR